MYGADRAAEDWPSVVLSKDGRWLVVMMDLGWTHTEIYLLDRLAPEAGFTTIVEGVEAYTDAQVVDGQFYLLTNWEAPNYRLFRVAPEQPARDRWHELLRNGPGPRAERRARHRGRSRDRRTAPG